CWRSPTWYTRESWNVSLLGLIWNASAIRPNRGFGEVEIDSGFVLGGPSDGLEEAGPAGAVGGRVGLVPLSELIPESPLILSDTRQFPLYVIARDFVLEVIGNERAV
ncbi:hypothetical protein, partial [Streptomyces sp. 900105245]